MATLEDVALLRLVALGIAAPPRDTAAEVVERLAAMQAQDYKGVLTSVALRTEARTHGVVEKALDEGSVVRSWPMRGTLHFVAAADLPWMLDLMAARPIAAAKGRRADLGLDERQLQRAADLAGAALRNGPLPRGEMFAVWDDAGLSTAGQRGVHMLRHLAMTGLVCYGPTRGGEQAVVLVEEWIPRPRRPGREEALADLASRYFRGHGPATVKDLARWTQLPAADVKVGVAAARPGLASMSVDGTEYLMDPETPDLLADSTARGVFLLPGFDEFMLGYADRGAALPAEFADLICPGGNGMFRATVVSGGQVVGVWRHAGRGAKRAITAEPFTRFTKAATAAINDVYATLP